MNVFSTIFLSTGYFCLIILFLTTCILIARSKLVRNTPVSIVINNQPNSLTVSAGGTLLTSLADNNIFISSACGGQGTCGQCKVMVTEGGGGLLPTETAHITRKQASQGYRLGCQLKVKNDLHITLPDSVFSARKMTCTVRSNRNTASFIKELVLQLPQGESLDFRAGGYIQIECGPHTVQYNDFDIDDNFSGEWDTYNLRKYKSVCREPVIRAYSMANYPEEKTIVMLNVRIALPPPGGKKIPPGIMSSYIFGLKPGDTVTVSGPYGEFYARETHKEMIFIGGGAGMAPMRSHIFDQLRRIHTNRKISFWYGARSKKELFYTDEFNSLAEKYTNFTFTAALSEPLPEDNWNGCTGFIHEVLLREYLAKHPSPEACEYYLCGPPLMLSACRKMLDNLGVDPEDVLFDDFG